MFAKELVSSLGAFLLLARRSLSNKGGLFNTATARADVVLNRLLLERVQLVGRLGLSTSPSSLFFSALPGLAFLVVLLLIVRVFNNILVDVLGWLSHPLAQELLACGRAPILAAAGGRQGLLRGLLLQSFVGHCLGEPPHVLPRRALQLPHIREP